MAPRHLVLIRGRLTVPGPTLGSFAANVAELDAGHCAFSPQESRDAFQLLNLPAFPQSKITMGAPAIAFNRSRFSVDQAGAIHRKASEMHHMPVIRVAIPRAILAHW